MTDPIADYLTRLRNAIKANHRVVEIPASNIKKEMTRILHEKGYILNYKFVEDGPQGTIKIALKYDPVNKVNSIKNLKRISTPGLRKYVGYREMPRVLNGLGIAILSTSKGIMKMSRIGNSPISVPSGVNIDVKDNVVTVKGPKGELKQNIDSSINVELKDGELLVSRKNEQKQTKAFHGLYRSLINNMIIGVTDGYEKQLELVGVGFRASNTGNTLELSLGYSHPIYLVLPPEITIETKSERNQNPIITVKSIDKQLIGQVCAKIRSLRKPEPYKGKGVKFVGEHIRRKAGKAAAK